MTFVKSNVQHLLLDLRIETMIINVRVRVSVYRIGLYFSKCNIHSKINSSH